MQWHYISFASETDFLGAFIVEGANEVDALRKCSEMGGNPGGEALVLPWPREDAAPDPSVRNRLLSRDDVLVGMRGVRLGDMDESVADRIADSGITVCEEHNTP
jgi:hypothetical protein